MPDFITNSPEETQQIAVNLGQELKPGSIVLLYGDLGYGKTTFVQGLAKGLGIEKRIISPTFVVVRTYRIKKYARPEADRGEAGIMNFYHIDLYRIESEKGLENLGLREILDDENAIVVIEWPEKLGTLLPEKRTDIYFEHTSERERKISIQYKES